MMSLFSNFDLYYFKGFQFLMVILFLNLLSSLNTLNLNKILIANITSIMESFVLSLKPKKFNKMMSLMFFSMMMLLFLINFPSVTSYNFALSSQIGSIMFVSMSFWLSFVMFMNVKMMKGFIMHCIPEGTPLPLTWFLFVIELISNSIRPMTITVRLVANILAGHLLMILLSKLVMKMSILSLAYTILNMIEFLVAMIQSYIFMTMLTLYYSELE